MSGCTVRTILYVVSALSLEGVQQSLRMYIIELGGVYIAVVVTLVVTIVIGELYVLCNIVGYGIRGVIIVVCCFFLS